MKSHITKVVAMLMAVLMLISLVPAAALPDLTLPDLQSVTIDGEAEQDTTSADSSDETATDSSASEDGLLTEEEIAALEDAQVSDEELLAEAISGVTLGKDVVTNDTEYYANNYGTDLVTPAPADEDTSPYEPAKTENENDPFLPGGDAWVNIDNVYYGSPATPTISFSEWSANTTFQNTSGVYYRDDDPTTPQDETLQVEYYIFPDVDLIHGDLWGNTKASGATLQLDNYSYPGTSTYNTLREGDNAEGYAYNRYDAQQGKWGVTFDVNRTLTSWTVDEYIDMTKTPFLMFSTEQVDGVTMSIAVKIGTPVVDENGHLDYEYRWYTVTDDNPHPNINVNNDTAQNTDDDPNNDFTMIPDVTIGAAGAVSPVHNSATHIDGATTGCVDMTYWLPFVENKEVTSAAEGVDFKTYHVAEVSVSTPSGIQASRLNYLYFLNQASIFMGAQANTGSNRLANEGADDYYTNDDQNGWQGSEVATLGENYVYTIDLTEENIQKAGLTDADFVTDKNGVQCYNLTIPVRKWINVAKDARVLSFTLSTVPNEATDGNGDGQITNWTQWNLQPKPTISIWGNNQGFIDCVLDEYGVYANEECLFVSGGRYGSGYATETPYLISSVEGKAPKYATTDFNNAYDHYTVFMDHEGFSNWYDLLYSPDMEKAMVTDYTADASEENPNMYGWAYISSIRLVLPRGVKYTYVTGNLSPNTASLNSASGAYDGGTGVEANTVLDTYQEDAAAYGPLLADSDPFVTTSLLPSDAEVYGKLVTVTNKGTDGSIARFFTSLQDADVSYDAGEQITSGTVLPVYAQAQKSDNPQVTYYYTHYKGRFGWLSTWGAKLTAFSPMTYGESGSYTYSDGYTGAKGRLLSDLSGTLTNTADAATGSDKYFEVKKNADNVNYVDMSWYIYKALLTQFDEDETCINANSQPITLADGAVRADQFATKCSDNSWSISSPGYGKVFSRLISGSSSDPNQMFVTLGENAILSYHFTPGLWPGASAAIAFKVTINGVADYYYLVKGEGNTLKLIAPTGIREDIAWSSDENGSYSGYISVGDFLAEYGNGATEATFEEIHVQMCEGQGMTLSISAMYPENDDGEIEFATDRNGNTVIGESYNIVADVFNGKKYDGTNGKLYGASNGKINEHALLADTDADGSYMAQQVNGEYQTGPQGWYFNTATELGTEMKSASTREARFEPALGCFSIPFAGPWNHVLFTHKDGGVSATDYPYMYFSAAARDPLLVGAADNTEASMMFFVVDGDGYIWYYDLNNAAGPRFTNSGATYDYTNGKMPDGVDSDDYLSTMNIALDLTTSGISKIKSIGVMFQNSSYATTTIDFYLNYCYISTTVPSLGYDETVVEREFVHNYYMMDNNIGRYATRYPVFNNPTGKIYTDADRVNPLKIKRGDYFYEGHFFNGLPLDNMYKVDTSGELIVKETTDASGNVTKREYIKAYDETEANLDDRLVAVWFYKYEVSDLLQTGYTDAELATLKGNLKKITDYYEFVPDDDGVSEMVSEHTFVAVWGHSRWPNYDGKGAAFTETLGYYKDYDANGVQTATGLEGVLVDMFSANNNCLVRSGLETIKYKTTYITAGGQMSYKGSSGITSGVIANTDNRYIFETSLMAYFKWPEDMTGNVVDPVRYGYTFDGWFTTADLSDTEPETDATRENKLARFNIKENNTEDVFYAHWTKNSKTATATYGYGDGTPAVDDSGNAILWGNLVNTLTFMNLDGSKTYMTREAGYDDDFIITIPNSVMLYNAKGDRISISGWAIDINGDGKYSADAEGASSMYTVFAPGEKVTVSGNITLVPVAIEAGDDPVRVKITLSGAKLYAKTVSGGYGEIKTGDGRGVTVSNDGDGNYTYLNVPRNLVVRAIPLDEASIVDGMGWQLDVGENDHVVESRECWEATVAWINFVSTNKDYYDFAAYTDMDISYASYVDGSVVTNRDQFGAVITSYTDTRISNGQMMAYAQFDLPETLNGHKTQFIECGTMYTSESRMQSLMGGDLSKMIVTWQVGNTNGQYLETTELDLSTVEIVRREDYKATFLPCTETNSMNQFYFMLTNTTTDTLVAYTRPYLSYWIDLNDDNKVTGNEIAIAYSNYVMKTWIPAA